MLERLGLTESARTVYLEILNGAVASTEALAAESALADLSVVEIEHALANLAAEHLITPIPGTAGHFQLVDPAVGLAPRVATLSQELETIRQEIAGLSIQHRHRVTKSVDSFIEIVGDLEDARKVVNEAHMSATSEVLAMERPPYYGSAGDQYETEAAKLDRGVSYRIIYEQSAVDEPGRWADICEGVALGEQARVVAQLPLRLIVVDRQIAFLPARAGAILVDPLLVVHECSLLDAILDSFEGTWARALPVDGVAADVDRSTERELAALLAAGLSDEAIARHLGVSHRTAQRRISALMARLGVRSRFQAGIRAHVEGLI